MIDVMIMTGASALGGLFLWMLTGSSAAGLCGFVLALLACAWLRWGLISRGST